MAALRELLADFGIKVDNKALDFADKQLGGFVKSIETVEKRLKGGFGFQDLGIRSLVNELGAEAGEIGKVAKTAGVDITDLQRLMFQTGKGADELGGAFRVLQRNMVTATGKMPDTADGLGSIDQELGIVPGGGKKAAEAFKLLGITLDEVNNLDTAELFTRIGEGIGGLESPAQRTKTAMDLFGRKGAELVPVFLKDKEKLRELGEEFDSVGGFTEDFLKKSGELKAANKSLDLGWNKLKILLGEQFIPLLADMTRRGSEIVRWFLNLTKNTSTWKTILGFVIAALVIMNAQTALLIAKEALLLAPWVALFILVEDIVTFFRGGDSLVGRFLDKIGEALNLGPLGKKAQQAIKDIFGAFNNSENPLRDRLAELGYEALEGFYNILQAGIGKIKGWLDSLDEAVWNWVTGLAEAGVNGAKALVDGFVNSLKSAAGSAWDAVKDFGKGIIKSFGVSLDAHSPSRAAATQAQNFVDGAEGPIAGYAPSAAKTATTGGRGGVNVGHIEVNISGNASREDVAGGVRDGINQAHNDERRAALAALEPAVP